MLFLLLKTKLFSISVTSFI